LNTDATRTTTSAAGPTAERSLYAQHLDHVQGTRDPAGVSEAMDAWYGPTLPEDRDARILDFGCGQGALLRWLSRRGYRNLEGLDIIDDYQHAIEQDTGAAVSVVDDGVEFISRSERRYDAIYCLDVLEHVTRDDAQRMVRAFANALRPGGRLIVAGPHAATPGGLYTRYLDWTHTNCFTVASLSYLLRGAGLGEGRVVIPRFRWGLKPTRWVLQSMRKFLALWRRLSYLLEMPGDPTAPPHFHMRLVVWSERVADPRSS